MTLYCVVVCIFVLRNSNPELPNMTTTTIDNIFEAISTRLYYHCRHAVVSLSCLVVLAFHGIYGDRQYYEYSSAVELGRVTLCTKALDRVVGDHWCRSF